MSATDWPDVEPCLAAGCTRRPALGTRLCAVDQVLLGDWLAQIGAEYSDLDARPSMQAPSAGSTGGGGLKSHRSVGNLDVMVLRDARSAARTSDDPDGNRGRGVLEVLGYWADWIRAERGLPGPTRPAVAAVHAYRVQGPLCEVYASFRNVGDFLEPCGHASCRSMVLLTDVPAYPTVATERALLRDEFRWALRQPWVGTFFDEVRTIWSLLREANGHAAAPPRLRCPGCGSSLRWESGTARCEGCGTAASGLAVLRRHATGAAA